VQKTFFLFETHMNLSSLPHERERRWLIDPKSLALTNLDGHPFSLITQGYLSAAGTVPVFRIRFYQDPLTQTLTEAVQTVKAPTGDGMAEVEFPIPEDAAPQLMAMATAKLTKVRYCIQHSNGQVIELDLFKGDVLEQRLIIAEIELPSFDAPVTVPPWFGPEITGIRALSNVEIAYNPRAAAHLAEEILENARNHF
jgi:adenylate cyclase